MSPCGVLLRESVGKFVSAGSSEVQHWYLSTSCSDPMKLFQETSPDGISRGLRFGEIAVLAVVIC